MAGQRILITGASGFVGACLAHALVDEGRDVHLVLRAGTDSWRLVNLQGRCTFHWTDVRDADGMRRAVATSRPDIVYHLAAHGAYPFQKERAPILASNFLGTANLLDALEGHDYTALVNVGSSSEYGFKSAPMREDDRLEPRTDYGVSKAASTLLCQAEALKGRPVVTVRIFSAYGPWEDSRRLVPYVMGCCRTGVRPKVTSGIQPRDFIHVDDVIDLLKIAATNARAHGCILHAGTGRQHRVRDMVETIVRVCGGLQAEFGAESLRPDEPTHWVASIQQTTAVTGWTPRHDLESGVRQMWSWFQAQTTCKAAA